MHKTWMIDIAREQSPSLDHLYQYAHIAQSSGYQALGLYLEHRYAFDCAPWAHGKGCITPNHIKSLQSEFPSLEIVPFINLLGHFEGFLYAEQGRELREELFTGLQACASCPEFIALAENMLDEVIQTFNSQVIHIGGDETYQLGRCEKCKARMAGKAADEKAWLYSQHFIPLINRVIQAGRTPAVWGDMFLDHPDALQGIPKQTIIYDWQYMNGLKESSPKFSGHPVVGCPTLHVYNAPWMHVEGSEENVRTVSADIHDLNLHGFCLTTWECGLFGSFDTLFPAVQWAAITADNPQNPQKLAQAYESSQKWAELIGIELEQIGGVFAYSKLRNPLKVRFLLYGNPFLAWMHHRQQLAGEDGTKALAILEQALFHAQGEAEKGIAIFVRSAIEFVRLAEEARIAYAEKKPEMAASKLAPTRHLFDNLEAIAKQSHARIGGSLADVERCRAAKRHVEIVIQRIKQYGNGELGYLPAFEVITNPRFMPHDQGCWWLVNNWANQ
ncbi:family 20 glycosylhydrolase [Kamptonema cortianum]|nr:family 20 glycosylhydrolase [Geitlerinema splendidum]MDK3155869.1 family 20 glycosylhydrolase [Kamptonema cortianum]